MLKIIGHSQVPISAPKISPNNRPDGYAILQLSNGDKLNLTRDEFSTIMKVKSTMAAPALGLGSQDRGQ